MFRYVLAIMSATPSRSLCTPVTRHQFSRGTPSQSKGKISRGAPSQMSGFVTEAFNWRHHAVESRDRDSDEETTLEDVYRESINYEQLE